MRDLSNSGRPHPRAALDTPALVLDRRALDRNIARMASAARAAGVALRPHAKTHKCAEIARLQLEAGAIGVSCAKLGEAESLAAAGIRKGLLLTSPVVSVSGVRRLYELHATVPDLACVIDHPEALAQLARTFDRRRPLTVLIDVDPGMQRTGVVEPAAAVALFEAIASSPAFRYGGVQFYSGADQHVRGFAARAAAVRQRMERLDAVHAALTRAGAPAAAVTGGGTGTYEIDLEIGRFTELQVGSYVFMDVDYARCEFAAGGSGYEQALYVDTRVVSTNVAGLATVDAGLKSLAADSGEPSVAAGAPAASTYSFMGDEHGHLHLPAGERLPLGTLVTLAPAHCDPTVNLYDAYAVVDGDTVVDRWAVVARGRSQ